MRTELCMEAIRLGRVLAALAPGEGEVHGLLALMELQASRLGARTGPGGEPILLGDQDRSRWDRLLIAHGLAELGRAQQPGGALGPYALQAAIAACHARARTAAETDWVRVAELYGALAQLAPSPVVELNRAVAVASAFGPEAGLAVLDGLEQDPRDAPTTTCCRACRADLLARLGRFEEAQVEIQRAAELTANERERAMLLERASAYAWEAGRRREPGG